MPKHLDAVKLAQNIPESELWRMFIDGFRQDEGPYAFDKGLAAEKGYYASMNVAWKKMMDELAMPLTAETFYELHENAIGNLQVKEEDSHVMRNSGDAPHMFSLLSSDNLMDEYAWNCTKEGIQEFVKFCRNNQKALENSGQMYAFEVSHPKSSFSVRYDLYDPKKSHQKIARELNEYAKQGIVSFSARGNAKDGVNFVLEQYRKQIEKAKTDDDKLFAIAACVAGLERVHAFRDANCRTMILTLNKLLLQHKLLPVILENPNRMDLLSTQQLVVQIKLGQAQFTRNLAFPIQEYIESRAAIQKDREQFKSDIKQLLAEDPLRALEQLHEVFIKLRAHEIETPNAGDRQRRLSFSIGSKSMRSSSEQSKLIQDVLAEIYAEKFHVANEKLARLQLIAPQAVNEFQMMQSQRPSLSKEQKEQTLFKYEKMMKIANRTPIAADWMKTKLDEISTLHTAIHHHAGITTASYENQGVRRGGAAKI